MLLVPTLILFIMPPTPSTLPPPTHLRKICMNYLQSVNNTQWVPAIMLAPHNNVYCDHITDTLNLQFTLDQVPSSLLSYPQSAGGGEFSSGSTSVDIVPGPDLTGLIVA